MWGLMVGIGGRLGLEVDWRCGSERIGSYSGLGGDRWRGREKKATRVLWS